MLQGGFEGVVLEEAQCEKEMDSVMGQAKKGPLKAMDNGNLQSSDRLKVGPALC